MNVTFLSLWRSYARTLRRSLQLSLITGLCLFSASLRLGSQGYSPTTPAKEYIRLNGKVIAVENLPLPTFTYSTPTHTAGSSTATTTISWNAPGHTSAQVWLSGPKSPAGTIVANLGTAAGSTPALNWVTNGTRFYLVDGNAQLTLATLTVTF